MLRSVLKLSAAVAFGVAVPQLAAAQSFYEDGPRPYVVHPQDDVAVDRDAARIVRRRDIGPGDRGDDGRYRPRVVYDERDPYWSRDGGRGRDRDGGRGGDGGYGRPLRPVYGPGASGYGSPRFRAGYAPAAYGVDPTPVGPVPAGAGYGTIPEVGCVTQQSEGVTPAGWHKIVTHRTCYRR